MCGNSWWAFVQNITTAWNGGIEGLGGKQLNVTGAPDVGAGIFYLQVQRIY